MQSSLWHKPVFIVIKASLAVSKERKKSYLKVMVIDTYSMGHVYIHLMFPIRRMYTMTGSRMEYKQQDPDIPCG